MVLRLFTSVEACFTVGVCSCGLSRRKPGCPYILGDNKNYKLSHAKSLERLVSNGLDCVVSSGDKVLELVY